MIKNHIKTFIFTTLDILQEKKIDDYENIYSLNPLYLTISHASGYIEEKKVNKYLIFNSTELHSTDENKELLQRYIDAFIGIRNKINKMW